MSIAEISLEEAWALLESDGTAQLVDVRTQAEWQFVGVPNLEAVDKQVRLVEWNSYPGGAQNDKFVDQAGEGLSQDQPVLFLCRSGARSMAAATSFAQAGFTKTFNVLPGFEGHLDAEGHRHGGWKENLPWLQG